jgi:hypothetical protein
MRTRKFLRNVGPKINVGALAGHSLLSPWTGPGGITAGPFLLPEPNAPLRISSTCTNKYGILLIDRANHRALSTHCLPDPNLHGPGASSPGSFSYLASLQCVTTRLFSAFFPISELGFRLYEHGSSSRAETASGTIFSGGPATCLSLLERKSSLKTTRREGLRSTDSELSKEQQKKRPIGKMDKEKPRQQRAGVPRGRLHERLSLHQRLAELVKIGLRMNTYESSIAFALIPIDLRQIQSS